MENQIYSLGIDKNLMNSLDPCDLEFCVEAWRLGKIKKHRAAVLLRDIMNQKKLPGVTLQKAYDILKHICGKEYDCKSCGDSVCKSQREPSGFIKLGQCGDYKLNIEI